MFWPFRSATAGMYSFKGVPREAGEGGGGETSRLAISRARLNPRKK